MRLGVGDGQTHPYLDHLTGLARAITGASSALVSLVERDRQYFVSRVGLDAESTGRSESFCGHCVAMRAPLVVPDSTQDPRFAGNPLVVATPFVNAYLGMPLFAGPTQSAIGTLCVLSDTPRAWTDAQQTQLAQLASMVEVYLDGLAYRRVWEDSPLSLVILDQAGRCLRANPAFERLSGRPLSSLLDLPLTTCVLPADRPVLAAMVAHAIQNRQSPTRRELRFVRITGEIVNGGVSVSPSSDVTDQVVCVIRDISLERRSTARSGVVAEVRGELGAPIDRARQLVAQARAAGGPGQQLDALDAILADYGGLLDARMGDLSARTKVESELHASEQRLRSLMEHVLGPLLVIDDRGRIVDANASVLADLGWRYDQLVGQSLRTVQPSFTDFECRRMFEVAVSRTPTVAPVGDLSAPDQVSTWVRGDGTPLQAEVRWMAMDWNGPGRLVIIARDVTEATTREQSLRAQRDTLAAELRTGQEQVTALQQMEADLKANVEEKETLLKEIHHRVKNNLQMVSSLLTLQTDQMPDERSRALLAESVRRVRSMALIHQHLYGSASLERVDLGSYANNLAEALRSTLAPDARVDVHAGDVEVSVEHAAPVCLILNELLTNAFKYGCSADGTTHIDVTLTETAREVRLTVRDRGPGLPAGFRLRGNPSLGLQLVVTLTRQLRGKIDARSDGGALFELQFPV